MLSRSTLINVNEDENYTYRYLSQGALSLQKQDSELFAMLESEYQRQMDTLYLVASAGGTDNSVMACEGSAIVNITAEGYPQKRFHAGCEYVDKIEQLAIDRAKAVFNACYANVQPHCASFANQIVMHGLLQPGDTILGMDLSAGGHLSHGSKPNISGRLFNAFYYGINKGGRIDFEQVWKLARKHRPKMIICGTSGYSRSIDFAVFRKIADEIGAYVLADVTHIAGLIAAGLHANPINDVHFTTMCTFKQLYGPRGGLILSGKDYDLLSDDGKRTISDRIQSSVFPLIQGSPMVNNIAGKARAFHRLMQPKFKPLANRIVKNASTLAKEFSQRGFEIVSGGTDNHIVMLNLEGMMTGYNAEKALESCGIITNKNAVPDDKLSPLITSGLRIGTNTISLRGMKETQMSSIADLVTLVLRKMTSTSQKSFSLNEDIRDDVRSNVRKLCRSFPLPYDCSQY